MNIKNNNTNFINYFSEFSKYLTSTNITANDFLKFTNELILGLITG